MLKLKKVAITGSIASGKSYVCKLLARLGAYVVNSDEIVHQLLTPETELGKRVIQLLGEDIVVNGVVDRKRIARQVFLNPKRLRSLEHILHPQVYEEIEGIYETISRQEKQPLLFVVEIPLLFETGTERYFDETIAVAATTEIRWERYRKATGYEREDFDYRNARQLSQEEKAKRADYVIENNGSLEELQLKTIKLFDTLCGVKVRDKTSH